ncbi:MAG: MotA/TolQ/ExbB proton channel family protein [Alphaproteobacteria bacterium]|nr:MAG: hypothetical protein B6I23_03000 [Rickettsiaceae bacterium 4572_127]
MNFSFIHLIFSSGWFIQGLSLLLLLGSVYVWAIVIEKWRNIKHTTDSIKIFSKSFFSHNANLELLYTSYKNKSSTCPSSRLFLSVMSELKRTKKSKGRNEHFLKERIEKIIFSTTENEISHLQTKLDFLSVASSTAPFVGLFGTVWGIMQSFSAMGSVGNANLSVIAPGIATALSTTALGLIVAIPASIAVSFFNQKIEKIENDLLNLGLELEMLISRKLEEGKDAI